MKFSLNLVFSLLPAIAALVVVLVVVRGKVDTNTLSTSRALASNDTAYFMILSAVDINLKKYCIKAPNLTVGTNLLLASCRASTNSSVTLNGLLSTKGIWWAYSPDQFIFSRDDPTLCLTRNNTLLILNTCNLDETGYKWTAGVDNTIIWLRNKAKVITIQNYVAYEGAKVAVLDRDVNSLLYQTWIIDFDYNYTTPSSVSRLPTPVPTRSPTKKKPTERPKSDPSPLSTFLPTRSPSLSRRYWIRTTVLTQNVTQDQDFYVLVEYGHNYADCFQGQYYYNGYWLVALHSPNYSSTSFNATNYVSKCSSGSFSWSLRTCSDDQWRISLIDCAGYICPPNLESATILAQSNRMQTFGRTSCATTSGRLPTTVPTRSATSRKLTFRPNFTSVRTPTSLPTRSPSLSRRHWIRATTQLNTYHYDSYPHMNFSIEYGHNDPACFQGYSNYGHWLVALHSPKYQLASFDSTYYVSKCSISSFTWNLSPCDDEWQMSLIDCAGYYCPTSLELATILAQIKLKTYGSTICSNIDPGFATCDASSKIKGARAAPSQHIPPKNGAIVSNIAFSSNFKIAEFRSSSEITNFQVHVHNKFEADVWSWLGNVFDKKEGYGSMYPWYSMPYSSSNFDYLNNNNNQNNNNNNFEYSWDNIMVTGTWNENEYGADEGKDYICRKSSEDAFAYFYKLDATDPRHPSQVQQRRGVYSSYMFASPYGGNGIHLIHLDIRTHRSPTRKIGNVTCEYEQSTMLGPEQWSWLEDELNKDSEIKVIGSAIPILPPTFRGRRLSRYCAYDGLGGSFDKANEEANEDTNSVGPSYDTWSEMPQQRTKLLQLSQRSINDGHTKKIIFISGNKYTSEIMVKAMQGSEIFGPEQTFYEVSTSFSSDLSWSADVRNSNRLYNNSKNEFCLDHGVCSSQLSYNQDFNYGGVRVDWKDDEIILAVFTPHLKDTTVVTLTIPF